MEEIRPRTLQQAEGEGLLVLGTGIEADFEFASHQGKPARHQFGRHPRGIPHLGRSTPEPAREKPIASRPPAAKRESDEAGGPEEGTTGQDHTSSGTIISAGVVRGRTGTHRHPAQQHPGHPVATPLPKLILHSINHHSSLLTIADCSCPCGSTSSIFPMPNA